MLLPDKLNKYTHTTQFTLQIILPGWMFLCPGRGFGKLLAKRSVTEGYGSHSVCVMTL